MTETLLPDLLGRAEAQKVREERRATTLASSIAELEQRIDRQSAELVEQQQLEREVEASGVVYEYALARLKELSVQRGIQQADARVLSEAEVPTEPSAPNSKLILALAVAVGLMAGSGIVLVRESEREVFRTADDLERETGLPVVAELPLLPGARRKALKEVLSGRTSPFSEATRGLRTSVLMTGGGNLPKVIAFTSCTPQEGKTTTVMAFANSLSMMGHNILVVDADLRRRSLSQRLGLGGKTAGLAAAIVKESKTSEIVFRRDDIELDFVAAEVSPYNPADLLSSAGFSKFLGNIKGDYDCVVFDTPPCLVVPDARLIAAFADALYLVVQWDRTSRWQVREALRDFETAQLQVRGAILSMVNPKGMRSYGYGDRRGAYGYGSSYYQEPS